MLPEELDKGSGIWAHTISVGKSSAQTEGRQDSPRDVDDAIPLTDVLPYFFRFLCDLVLNVHLVLLSKRPIRCQPMFAKLGTDPQARTGLRVRNIPDPGRLQLQNALCLVAATVPTLQRSNDPCAEIGNRRRRAILRFTMHAKQISAEFSMAS